MVLNLNKLKNSSAPIIITPRFGTKISDKNSDKFTIEWLKVDNNAKNTKRHKSLLDNANYGWKKQNNDTWFGKTYQVITSKDWGKQTISINLKRAITYHITKCMRKLEESNATITQN